MKAFPFKMPDVLTKYGLRYNIVISVSAHSPPFLCTESGKFKELHFFVTNCLVKGKDVDSNCFYEQD